MYNISIMCNLAIQTLDLASWYLLTMRMYNYTSLRHGKELSFHKLPKLLLRVPYPYTYQKYHM